MSVYHAAIGNVWIPSETAEMIMDKKIPVTTWSEKNSSFIIRYISKRSVE